jgi:iron-sulfur cluster assembly accessory protein
MRALPGSDNSLIAQNQFGGRDMGTIMSDSGVDAPTKTKSFMLTLTDMAAAKIQAILKERNVPDYGLRVFVAGGGCSGPQYGMVLESQAQDTDTVIESSGLKLFVDPASAEYLHGATIDYENRPAGGGFRIESPNVANTCGCGCEGCH